MTTGIHPLLARQLRRAHRTDSVDVAAFPQEWQSFITMVDQAYRDADSDRSLVQRSIEIASQELVERNQQLILQNQKFQEAEKEVRQSRDQLEARVITRTAELWKAKEKAEQNKEHFQLLLNSTGEGIYGIDEHGLCTFVNIAAAKMLGYSVSEIIGKNVHDLIHYKKADGSPYPVDQCPIYQSVNLHQSCGVREDVFWTRDHLPLQVEYSSHPMREGTTFIGSVVAFSDIGARKQVEAALRQAKELAEHASQTKSEFLARMSHEIRTPLNGVIGMIDQLIQTEQSELQRRYTSLARTAAESLLEVITEILDFSKIEAGRVEIETVELSIPQMITDLVELFKPIAARKNLTITGTISRDVPAVLKGDTTRVRQVLTNLLSNAIKFTGAGSVSMRVAVVSKQTDRCNIRVEVQDTGIGIPTNRLDRLFKSFSQVDTSTTRQFGGSGLGLVISKRLVELMGGQIGVKSEPGAGTTFWFNLPLVVPAMSNATPPIVPGTSKQNQAMRDSISAIRGLHLLVAEDNEMNQFVTGEVLKQASCTCEFVVNGAAAVDAMHRGHYDAILMDCHMPIMDGLEATRQIRRFESSRNVLSRIPIIALTAKAVTGDREKCIAAGMDGYVVKPIRAAQLFAEMALQIPRPEVAGTGGRQ